jgi:hypothetical protein
VTSSREVNRTDRQVVEDLVKWRQEFEGGGVHLVGRKPRLEAGERWAARRGPVGISRRDPRARPDQWEPREGSKGLFARPEGTAYATDQRAFVSNSGKVKREWRWADVHAVRVTSDWRGIMLATSPDETEVDVVASEWNRWVIGAAPNPRLLAASWLRFEAAFAAYQGRLDGWMMRLPERLAEARAGRG